MRTRDENGATRNELVTTVVGTNVVRWIVSGGCMVGQVVTDPVAVALRPLTDVLLVVIHPPSHLTLHPPDTIRSSAPPLPWVSCVGVNIAGSTDNPTHGTQHSVRAVGSFANDPFPTGSGVGVPADTGASTNDGTPTPLPQPQAGRRLSRSVNVCAKPGATKRSETLTLPLILSPIACPAMVSSRLPFLCSSCRISCACLVMILVPPPSNPPWDEALAGAGKQATLIGRQAVSLPYPAQSVGDGAGVLVPAAPARRGGGTARSHDLVEPRWAPLRRLEKAARLHGPTSDSLLALGAAGRNVGRGPNVVARSMSVGHQG